MGRKVKNVKLGPLGKWVKLNFYENRCGIVVDWSKDPAIVQLGPDGSFEEWGHDMLTPITEREFDEYINDG